jgi:diacylglycerol kinase
MDTPAEKKRFSILARIKSATHAWRGIGILIKSSHNAWGHIFLGLLAIYLGIILNISSVEWVLLFLAMGIVIITETINTAFEIDINLTSPEYHPYARDTKDVAAGAVLMSVILSIITAFFIFAPKIWFYDDLFKFLAKVF